jgi:hypothetical protein
MKWLAVTTTASTIAVGISTAKPRSARLSLARKITMPSSTFHPAWKLGMAAYWFTSAAGKTDR